MKRMKRRAVSRQEDAAGGQSPSFPPWKIKCCSRFPAPMAAYPTKRHSQFHFSCGPTASAMVWKNRAYHSTSAGPVCFRT